MKNTDIEQMQEYGITYKSINVYTYKEHHYDHLKDALKYAETDTKRLLEDNVIRNKKQ